jgi:hypothetical protein
MKNYLIVSVLLLLLSGCSTLNEKPREIDYGSHQKNTTKQFLFARIGENTSEESMNSASKFNKAFFYTIDKGEEHFYPWWITADFNENKLMKNVVIHFPVKIHFAGLHESVVQISVPSERYRSFPMIMHKWANYFRPIIIENQAIPVISASVNHSSLIINLDIPISLFFNNLNYFNGLCEFKDAKFMLKNGVCRFLDGNDIYLNYGNLFMEINNKTRYGVVKLDTIDNKPFGDFDFGETLIWDNSFIIFGEDFDSITPLK